MHDHLPPPGSQDPRPVSGWHTDPGKPVRNSSPRSGWEVFGIVMGVLLTVALVVGGLAVVGWIVLVYVGMHQWAANK
ncbi:hypothetical protein [Streptacidiphilus neutrinimicus]|uniref:hypothetical protein n=1 Tax=Streptacidiphilus neutrinimicus TaxID=105420 RepID=UPI00137651FA|nr:hypothetical protein [Streptacidiphilus neutrinimicus]